MMDFIVRLQQLRLHNTFIACLCPSLPSDFNATQSTIASYLKSHRTVDTNTVDHICAILLDHEVVLENCHSSDSSALWTNASSGCREEIGMIACFPPPCLMLPSLSYSSNHSTTTVHEFLSKMVHSSALPCTPRTWTSSEPSIRLPIT